MRDRFGVTNPRAQALRFHAQTGGSTLTAQQPENNVVRVAVQALSAICGGAQSLHTNAFDEALALPTERSARIALRTQQILAAEAGATDTADPLGGAYFIEALTSELEERARELIEHVDALGGAVAAIERGWVQDQIDDAAFRHTTEVEAGTRVLVGVNRFVEGETEEIELHRVDPEAERRQRDRTARVRAERDAARGRAWSGARFAPWPRATATCSFRCARRSARAARSARSAARSATCGGPTTRNISDLCRRTIIVVSRRLATALAVAGALAAAAAIVVVSRGRRSGRGSSELHTHGRTADRGEVRRVPPSRRDRAVPARHGGSRAQVREPDRGCGAEPRDAALAAGAGVAALRGAERPHAQPHSTHDAARVGARGRPDRRPGHARAAGDDAVGPRRRDDPRPAAHAVVHAPGRKAERPTTTAASCSTRG